MARRFSPLFGLAAIGGVALLAFQLTASPKRETETDGLPYWVRWQVQQAVKSGDPRLQRAAARVLRAQGYPEQADVLEWHAAKYVQKGGLQPGTRYRASLYLSGAECLAGAGRIKSELESKGFRDVRVFDDNPGWGKRFEVPDGFLECDWYLEGTWGGTPKAAADAPSEVYYWESV